MTVPIGLLYSQIGYDLDRSMRALACGPRDLFPAPPGFCLLADDGRALSRGTMPYWGEMWGRHWWIADFSGVTQSGRHRLEVTAADGQVWKSGMVDIGRDLLWSESFRHVALEQSRRRSMFGHAYVGWFDAGMHWQEANSHASLIIGLTDVLEFAAGRLSQEQRTLLEKQIVNGCQYLRLCQNRAAQLHFPAGSLCHEVPKWEHVELPTDATKAAVSWARAARLMSTCGDDIKRDYIARAVRALGHARTAQLPRIGIFAFPRGLPGEYITPHAWPTRELLTQAWAALELALCGLEQYQDAFADLADQILRRQIRPENAEGGYFGHFYEFEGGDLSEKAWTHALVNHQFSLDNGATFPNYVLPLIRACQVWPEHPSAPRWKAAAKSFAYGWLLPACRANAFQIVPQGYYRDQGLVYFAGLYHGANAIYGLTAALALELAELFGDRAFLPIATANLQWIAGVNVGVSREAMAGCHVFDLDIPDGQTLPVSMIHAVGQRCGGGWTNIRGSICNGFCAGRQFRFDLAPTVENDARITLTDEDWITHCGGWLSGLSRLAVL